MSVVNSQVATFPFSMNEYFIDDVTNQESSSGNLPIIIQEFETFQISDRLYGTSI